MCGGLSLLLGPVYATTQTVPVFQHNLHSLPNIVLTASGRRTNIAGALSDALKHIFQRPDLPVPIEKLSPQMKNQGIT
jgi:hypothetical protein